MLRHISRIWKRLQYLYRGIGLKRMTLRIAQKIVAAIYRHEIAYIIVRDVKQEDDSHVAQSRKKDHVHTECLVLETLESLREVMREIPPSIPIDVLKKHIVPISMCL